MRRKPLGYPRYMIEKRASHGVRYYWNPPSWARKRGCPLVGEPLGADYADAKRRCDEILNAQFDAWLTGEQVDGAKVRVVIATFRWLVAIYKASPKFAGLEPRTRKSYDAALELVATYKLKDGREFGDLDVRNITNAVVDRLHDKLRLRRDGTLRPRLAKLAMDVSRRSWFVARRARPDIIGADNPFEKMGIKYTAKPTRPVTLEEVLRLVEAADAAGEASIGTAAMIAYFWLIRQTDIINFFSWGHYRPAAAPTTAQVVHHKTGKLVSVPLYDADGSELWPELMARLDNLPRLGTLVVMRDRPDAKRNMHLPWRVDHFRHRFAALRASAGIDDEVKFMGMRHGGNTEAADAGLSDAQLRALSGHTTQAALLRYARETDKQRLDGARKRRDARTKKGSLSE